MKKSFKISRDALNLSKVRVLGCLKQLLHTLSQQAKECKSQKASRKQRCSQGRHGACFWRERAGTAVKEQQGCSGWNNPPPCQSCLLLGSCHRRDGCVGNHWASAIAEGFLSKWAPSTTEIPVFHIVCRGKTEKETNKQKKDGAGKACLGVVKWEKWWKDQE